MDDAEMTIYALRKYNVANTIVHVKDGEEALDFLFGSANFNGGNIHTRPGLILLDLKMPKLNGMEVLERVKSNVNTKKIPVVVLTSSKEDPDISKCYDLGANSYIVKPVEMDTFVEMVYKLGMYWMLINNPPRS